MGDWQGVFEAIFKLGIPVAGVSFVMVWWALRKGMLSSSEGLGALNKELEAMRKGDKKDRPAMNPVHSKWMKFGGGFYGTVAFYTYGLIEWQEIAQTIANFGGFAEFLSSINANLIINMLIEGLKNFIAAIAWPVYWMSELDSRRMWLWMLIAFLGYRAGMMLARHMHLRR